MAKRVKMSRGANKSNFANGVRINRKNAMGSPMRGGIRL